MRPRAKCLTSYERELEGGVVRVVGRLVGHDGPLVGGLEAEEKASLSPRRHLQVAASLREAHRVLLGGCVKGMAISCITNCEREKKNPRVILILAERFEPRQSDIFIRELVSSIDSRRVKSLKEAENKTFSILISVLRIYIFRMTSRAIIYYI